MTEDQRKTILAAARNATNADHHIKIQLDDDDHLIILFDDAYEWYTATTGTSPQVKSADKDKSGTGYLVSAWIFVPEEVLDE